MTSSLFGEKVNSSHVTSSPCDEFTVSQLVKRGSVRWACHSVYMQLFVCNVRSKLKVEDLKEKQLMIKDAQWAEDKEAAECRQCSKQFSVSRRRVCSVIVCDSVYDVTQAKSS